MDIRDQRGKAIDITTVENREQDLAREYILEDDTVFELGARYGSVSCVINSMLKCKTNQVVVEPDNRVWDALERNKAANNCEFTIIKGFVSAKKMDLTALDCCNGYGTTSVENVNSIIPSYTLAEIEEKYKLTFDVLVADCEGFLEQFFDENPTFCDGLRLLLFEADYDKKCNYQKIRTMLTSKGFLAKFQGHQNMWYNPNFVRKNKH
jgi:FkbM family methyltransferase